MPAKPIFLATHPRSCSTAFERVFMTRRDDLQCVHEPFGDAFYFGPERLSERYENDDKARASSGFADSTYKTVLDRIDNESSEDKRLFIKDITHYLVPPNGNPASIAPSLILPKKGVGTNGNRNHLNGIDVQPPQANGSFTSGTTSNDASLNGHHKKAPYPYQTESEPSNPTVIPLSLLKSFHFTFLIRHPRYSIPSYYRCTVPPLDSITGFQNFMPSEAGYDELRRVFDYLRSAGVVGPVIAGQSGTENETSHNASTSTNGNSHVAGIEICVVDADDLLDNPAGIIEAYCKSVGLEYRPEMLTWDTEADHEHAKAAFLKWKGFHEDAIDSTCLRARPHPKKAKSIETENIEWREKFGEQGAKIIRETVDANVKDYEYLKSFALKV